MVISTIPAGARNIKIEEATASENNLCKYQRVSKRTRGFLNVDSGLSHRNSPSGIQQLLLKKGIPFTYLLSKNTVTAVTGPSYD